MTKRAIALRGIQAEPAVVIDTARDEIAARLATLPETLELWATARGWASWEVLDNANAIRLMDATGAMSLIALNSFVANPNFIPWPPTGIRTYEVGQARRRLRRQEPAEPAELAEQKRLARLRRGY